MKKELKISAYAISHIGKVRGNLEDNFLLDDGKYIDLGTQKRVSLNNTDEGIQYIEEVFLDKKNTKCIFAVCDGMGGCNSGELASYIAVSKLASARNTILNNSDMETSVGYLQEYIKDVNKDILSYCSKNNESRGMGTTLVSLIIKDNKAIVANLGDSSAFMYKNNKLQKLSKTHTEGQRLVDLKILSEEELLNTKARHVLTRYLGMDPSFGIAVGDVSDYFDIEEKQYFLLCSDGLTDSVPADKINAIFKQDEKIDIEKVGRLLLGQALKDTKEKRGGSDNITILVIEVKRVKQTLIDRIISKF